MTELTVSVRTVRWAYVGAIALAAAGAALGAWGAATSLQAMAYGLAGVLTLLTCLLLWNTRDRRLEWTAYYLGAALLLTGVKLWLTPNYLYLLLSLLASLSWTGGALSLWMALPQSAGQMRPRSLALELAIGGCLLLTMTSLMLFSLWAAHSGPEPFNALTFKWFVLLSRVVGALVMAVGWWRLIPSSVAEGLAPGEDGFGPMSPLLTRAGSGYGVALLIMLALTLLSGDLIEKVL